MRAVSEVPFWLKQLKRVFKPDQPPIGSEFPVVSIAEVAERHLTGGSRHMVTKSPTFEAFRSSTKKTVKWGHYCDVYDDCLLPLRDWLQSSNETPGILEIGTDHGGSLIAWRTLFGEKSMVCGLDIKPKDTEFNDPQIKMVIGSQTDRQTLKQAVEHLPKLHLVVDDGSHIGAHQRASFEFLWNFLQPGGLYVVEDLHTSYWRSFERGILRRRKTGFIDYAKHLVDVQHAHYSSRRYSKNELEDFRDTIFNITFFDSVVAIRKSKLPLTRVRFSNFK